MHLKPILAAALLGAVPALAGAADTQGSEQAELERRIQKRQARQDQAAATPRTATSTAQPEWSHAPYSGGVRLGLGIAPGIDESKVSGSTLSLDAGYGLIGDVGLAFDTGIDGGLGLAILPSFCFRQVTGEASPGGVWTREQLKSYGLRLGVGPAYTANFGKAALSLEVTPFVGVGSATVRTEVVGFRDTSGSGIIYDYGGSVQLMCLFPDAIYAGLSGGYDAFVTHVQYSSAGPTFRVSGSGPMAEFILGMWF